MRIPFFRLCGIAAAVLCSIPVGAQAATISLITAGASSGPTAGAIGGDYIVQQIDPQSTGTGVIDPFVRIQAAQNEEGYNTSLSLPLNDKSPADGFTRALLLSEIPIVTINGVAYRQFLLDVNEDSGGPASDPHEYLSLNQIQIFQSNTDRDDHSFTSAVTATTPPVIAFGTGSTEIFRLNNAVSTYSEILLNYALNAGSGSGDMFLYVADSNFSAAGSFIILYSQFGDPSGASSSSDGFEEWAVLEAGPEQGPLVPEPTSIVAWLLGAGGLGLILRRRMSNVAA